MIILNPLHARFLLLLPRIETHAKFYFRFIRCPADRADHIAETIALAWQWFVQLDHRGNKWFLAAPYAPVESDSANQ